MIEIKNLNKKFGRHKALNNLNLTIGDGELFGFVGSNGAGKTTTMKICVGLLGADSGEVYIDGEQVVGEKKRDMSKVGYVPDFFGVYNNLTAHEYLTFFAATYDIWGETADKLADDLLELVNLSDKRDTDVNGLSRGMKQRLCLARALVHNPEILFLDEPASGLDPKARHELREILKNLTAMGKTIVISSHILPELIEMCTSIGIISHGRMMFNGSVAEAIKLQKGRVSIELTVLDKVEEAYNKLREFPEITDVDMMGNTINFKTSGEQEMDAVLLKTLVMNDIPVVGFARKTENAEDVLLSLMDGGNVNEQNNK